MKIKRGATFDIVMSLCILWIVGVWHMKDYLSLDITDEAMHFGELITTSLLGAFTFMSGFFLKKYEIIYQSFSLLKDYPFYNLSPQEKYTCLLTMLNFSSGELTVLLDTSKQRVSNIKASANSKLFGNKDAKALLRNLESM